MTILAETPGRTPPDTELPWPEVKPRPKGLLARHLDEYWPLAIFFYGYPVWWLLGLSKVIIFPLMIPMVWALVRHRSPRMPRGFSVYALFLIWAFMGLTVLWVQAPGTFPKSGLGPVTGFGYRGLWYVALTVTCLYIVNADRTRLSATRVSRMLAFMFLVTVAGGLLSLLAPTLDFPSAIELVLPQSFTSQPFMNALFHPRIALESDFLGYVQPRVTAPYSYPNDWGNCFGLLVPFFLFAWFGKDAGPRRYFAPLILAVAVVPMVYSLNRGLWAGLVVALLWVTIRRLASGDARALALVAGGVVVCVGAVLLTPLGTLVEARLTTPHSDQRRQDTAMTVLERTASTSPLLGYGGTRQMVGNFDSIAGGATPECHQCAAPPLGTQGFLWGLVFMTGFVGAGLMLSFLGLQFLQNARRSTSLSLLASTVVLSTVFYFLFYDSLDLALLITMIAIGLSARDHAPEPERQVVSS